jgi:protoporphyrinogen oxidase
MGFNVTIIESGSRVGGFARSFTRKGYAFDIGPHIFFGEKTVSKLKEYFDGGDVLIRNDNLKQGILIRNRLFRYPFQLGEILYKIEKRQLLSVVYDVFVGNTKAANTRDGEDESLETWVKGKIGPTLFEYIALDTYVQKLYGISASEISSDWGKHRLKPLAGMTLLQALRKKLNPFGKKGKGNTFYCSKGIGDVATHLADYIVKHGGRILLDCSVEDVELSNGRVKKMHVKRKGDRQSVSSDFFVSTIKIADLIGMIRPAPAAAVHDASAALKYRNLILLYLIVNKPKVLDNCLIYFSVNDTTFKRITEFKYFSSEMMPPNETTLALEVCADDEDEIWNAQDTEVSDKLIAELGQRDVVSREDVLESFVLRTPSVYPVYFLNYRDPLKIIFDYLKNIENMVSIGRQGLYQHDDMRTAIESGFHAVGLIARHKDKLPEVGKAVYDERLHRYDNIA